MITRPAPGPGLFRAMTYPFLGLGYIVRRPRLLVLAVIPLLIDVLVYALFLVLSYRYLWGVIKRFLPESEAWYLMMLAFVLQAFIIAIILLFTAFTFTIVASLVASPFNDALSERTEALATGTPAAPAGLGRNLAQAGRAVIEELKKLGFFLAVLAVLLLLNLVPGPGTLAAMVLGGVFTMFWLGLGFIDYAMARHDYRLGAKLGLGFRRFSAVLGFGAGVFVMCLAPFLGLVLLPGAVVGGTLLFLELEGKIAGPPGRAFF